MQGATVASESNSLQKKKRKRGKEKKEIRKMIMTRKRRPYCSGLLGGEAVIIFQGGKKGNSVFDP